MLVQCLLTPERAIAVVAVVFRSVRGGIVEVLVQCLLTPERAVAVVTIECWRVSRGIEMLL